ncbi:hypothetical protein F1D05_12330 [Kribbella qitaiheensis]|uniref:Uncharacterized protein n=1 Tax=Kribbella qitaiheensis TaxID=1544730 RepID=A0A7G6WX32_9ACTN|nr:hypothetical protein [Kribbella qitaiheensis]QNE18547.1 hypothetical protein F1D05_12330 [Kribbella qitaiheensis]
MATDIPDEKAAPTLREGVDYEVAEDVFGDLIGWCAAQAEAESAKPDPDPAVLQKWEDQATQYVAERKALDPRDRAAVAAAIAKYTPLVRQLYPGRWTDDD